VNLVSFALRRPVSLLMAVVAIVLAGLLALDRMPRDIFPDLGVPTIYVAQPYGDGSNLVFESDAGRIVGFCLDHEDKVLDRRAPRDERLAASRKKLELSDSTL
jgi:hypothetical protein